MRSSWSGTTRTSASSMPWSLSQVASWATFLSSVRPDRISSPITHKAAVQVFVSAIRAYIAAMTEYVTVAADDRAESRDGVIKLHGPEGFAGMRRAGRLAAEILDELTGFVAPGITTRQIDDLVHKRTLEGG